ncbi:MAG: DUF1905 domain-containing protein [Acidimicrobiia bacterium]
MDATFTFSNPLWKYGGANTWVFVTLPAGLSDEIADLVPQQPGFGSVRVAVRIGETEWSTSLFPDSKLGSYVLPVKRAVRDRERLSFGDTVEVRIRLVLE